MQKINMFELLYKINFYIIISCLIFFKLYLGEHCSVRAVVEIKGGFGNQIFQYAFANYIKNEGYRVTVNINKNNIHGIYLNSKILNLKKSSLFEVGLLNFFIIFLKMKSIKNFFQIFYFRKYLEK